MIDELSVTWDNDRVSISLRASIGYGQALPVAPQVLDGSPHQIAYRRLEALLAEYVSSLHHGRTQSHETLDRPFLFGDRLAQQHIPNVAA
jgi:hypothetical protein